MVSSPVQSFSFRQSALPPKFGMAFADQATTDEIKLTRAVAALIPTEGDVYDVERDRVGFKPIAEKVFKIVETANRYSPEVADKVLGRVGQRLNKLLGTQESTFELLDMLGDESKPKVPQSLTNPLNEDVFSKPIGEGLDRY